MIEIWKIEKIKKKKKKKKFTLDNSENNYL